MQNIDEITSPYLTSPILKRPQFFLFFEIETCFLVCNPIFGISLGVLKDWAKTFFSPRNHRGVYMPPPPPRGISCIRARVE